MSSGRCWGSNDARQNDVPSVVNAQYLSVTSGYHLSCLECGLDRWQICAQLCDERFRPSSLLGAKAECYQELLVLVSPCSPN
mmetsp:Transcript_10592/g.35436  ORF Transcript_10592/g.35436 Transcript_10592/m.35436 type:complete len:82 (+) Transcript_10592:1282-1527(+)